MVDWWAELGLSCNGSLERGLLIADAAAKAGFTTLKIPYWHVDELFRPGSISDERRESLRGHHLDFATVTALAHRARANGMKVAVSVTNRCRVAEAASVADVLKVGSFEILIKELIDECGDTRIPTVFSAGNATEEEVEAVARADCAGVLHCVSKYPTKHDEAGLRRLGWHYDGYSDHTADMAVIARAVHKWNAGIIELHVDLDDMGGGESGDGHVWPISKAAECIAFIRRGFEADNLGPLDEHERHWRADPSDGMRPMRGHS